MDNKQIDELTHNLEKHVEKKLEPFTRIITLAAMIGALIYLILFIYQGREGSLYLLFIPITWNNTIAYILTAIFAIITIYHLVSTIRFFMRRSAKKKNFR